MNFVSRRSLLALVMLVALADGIFAQASRPRSQRIDPLTSSISGRVTTADTGSPVRGAEVRLSIDGGIRRLVTTNGEGRFEIRNLPAGEYRLTVSKTGFITLEYGQQRPFETASTITLGEGQSATGNVALLRGGAIFGRVLDEFGDPSVGTRVQVLRNRAEVQVGVHALLRRDLDRHVLQRRYAKGSAQPEDIELGLVSKEIFLQLDGVSDLDRRDAGIGGLSRAGGEDCQQGEQ